MLSWAFPYFLRPPPGRNVLVRGMATMPKAGVSPLEGIVEADWYSTGLHVVHKLARPDRWISYEANEPIAMLVPQRRGDLEAFEPVVQDLDPETAAEYRQWRSKRQALLDRIGTREDVHASELDLDYLHGRNASGQQVVYPHVARVRGFEGEEGTSWGL